MMDDITALSKFGCVIFGMVYLTQATFGDISKRAERYAAAACFFVIGYA